ncbi:MAG: ABC transporter permease [Succinivibrionaceae bacterium]|nr:ABC transporter permease [Succinivibrionaceae bacterium]
MLFRMVKKSILNQKERMLIIALTVALGVSLITALLDVMLDIGDRMNRELKVYGANILVTPRGATLLKSWYRIGDEGEDGGNEEIFAASDAKGPQEPASTDERSASGGPAGGDGSKDRADPGMYLKESELGRIKTIFWAFNIVDFAPYLKSRVASEDGTPLTFVGTWFRHRLVLPTMEEVDTGMVSLKSWWQLEGAWPEAGDQVALGRALAGRLGLAPGSALTLDGRRFAVSGVFEAGGPEDGWIYGELDALQELKGLEDALDSVEISALTTPDNELSRRAAEDPSSLSVKEMETWYCTAYASSICYQLEEVLSGAMARPVRQVAAAEGAILEKTKLLMVLVTVLTAASSALGISNLVTAGVIERSAEIALMKAIGAHGRQVAIPVIASILVSALAGTAVGYGLGVWFASVIGKTVFNAVIEPQLAVIPAVLALVALICLTGSIGAIRMLLSLQPAQVLHGGRQ